MTERDDKLDQFRAELATDFDKQRARPTLSIEPIYDREPGEITGPGKLDGVTLTLEVPLPRDA